MEHSNFKKVPDLTAIILAGGSSSRIGLDRNKAMLELDGKNLLDIIISKLKNITENIMIVAPPQKYPTYSNVVPDLFPIRTPLVGIYTGLKVSTSCYNLIVGCDMPFVKIELFQYMIKQINSNDLIIPRYGNQYIEPLCAIYSKNCLEVIKKNIQGDILSIRKILPYLKVRFIEEEEIKKIDPHLNSFFNINFVEDLKKADKLIRKKYFKDDQKGRK